MIRKKIFYTGDRRYFSSFPFTYNMITWNIEFLVGLHLGSTYLQESILDVLQPKGRFPVPVWKAIVEALMCAIPLSISALPSIAAFHAYLAATKTLALSKQPFGATFWTITTCGRRCAPSFLFGNWIRNAASLTSLSPVNRTFAPITPFNCATCHLIHLVSQIREYSGQIISIWWFWFIRSKNGGKVWWKVTKVRALPCALPLPIFTFPISAFSFLAVQTRASPRPTKFEATFWAVTTGRWRVFAAPCLFGDWIWNASLASLGPSSWAVAPIGPFNVAAVIRNLKSIWRG